MSWSMNEVEGLARKAARGSGLSWGLAEEAGKSVRWLAAVGLPGPEMLLGLLSRNDGMAYDTICPMETDGTWAAKSGQLCPLIAGAAICDRAADLAAGRDIGLGPTSFPMLLLPFAAGVAATTGESIEISWPGTKAMFSPDGDINFIDDSTCETEQAVSVSVRVSKARISDAKPGISRADIPAETAGALGKFAHRTYAPETPESRLSGAGAGLTDND